MQSDAKAIKKIIRHFVRATNAFEVDTALALFAEDAVIEDVSVGEKFRKRSGQRKYLVRFFVEYKTVSRIESIVLTGKNKARARLDFTGDFGHETGGLDFTFNADGLISSVYAFLDE